jgi:hypothetical protein|tara:strand:- start:116 stop:436 length:321 start_codon:yes stop_codon:yes gene_type:complete
MANSFVTNLYPKPTQGTTMERIQLSSSSTPEGKTTTYNSTTKYIALDVQDADAFVNFTGAASQSAPKGHRLYAGRSYTFSKTAMEVASFIRAGATTSELYLTEFTD